MIRINVRNDYELAFFIWIYIFNTYLIMRNFDVFVYLLKYLKYFQFKNQSVFDTTLTKSYFRN